MHLHCSHTKIRSQGRGESSSFGITCVNKTQYAALVNKLTDGKKSINSLKKCDYFLMSHGKPIFLFFNLLCKQTYSAAFVIRGAGIIVVFWWRRKCWASQASTRDFCGNSIWIAHIQVITCNVRLFYLGFIHFCYQGKNQSRLSSLVIQQS